MIESGDLVVVALGGVQAFIGESRTTADLAAASGMLSSLAAEAARVLSGSGATLVFPEHTEEGGKPNRVVALTSRGEGRAVAGRAAETVREMWAAQVRQVFGEDARAPTDTPGFPDVSWVCVPGDRGAYAVKWDLAQRALAARRGVRAFGAVNEEGRAPCSLSPRWASSPPPPKARRHHRKEQLSRANWVKRQHGLSEDGARFPSTYAIASARFRSEVDARWDAEGVADAVRVLRDVVRRLGGQREAPVPGLASGHGGDRLRAWLAESAGAWVYPDRWREGTVEEAVPNASKSDAAALAERGRRAAEKLVERMRGHGVPAPAIYLAVVVQDLDDMGRFLSRRPVTVAAHQDVSRRLIGLAGRQTAALRGRDLLGVPVYAGGDDLLALSPAATALASAAVVHRLAGETPDLPTASTAVLFFHYHAQLRHVLVEAQRLLRDAKAGVPGKHALAVGFLRRSGARAESIQPWTPTPSGHSPEGLFERLGRSGEFTLSPRLVTVLERDAGELQGLRGEVYEAELRRLVGRHAGGGASAARDAWTADAGRALVELGDREHSAGRRGRRPAPVARVGVFLRQEAR
ncbi:Cas10/Cmr2 second palm domain-containing protein [Actinomadura algeriensis]|uniref:CRISPR-associated protein Cmr2 n=1 Tax=Actinomadura algeriensis TaxID=1679523 RepID=A0ABR9JTS1_9ACTN|nr:type III-B CRISPR-associated protein Cas10/Cmr2 [Actinomadura algeriensis]MBE1533960.1 CRISPR-associated protein Cmr2 [Actinomadura algeriensis]